MKEEKEIKKSENKVKENINNPIDYIDSLIKSYEKIDISDYKSLNEVLGYK